MYKHLLKKIIERGDVSDMEYLECLLDDFMRELEEEDEPRYKRLLMGLYCRVYGKHLNNELAHKWVSEMENKDGTRGEHWSIEQTSQYAGSYDKYDWYAVMNMMYSDYYNQRFDTGVYVELAKDWISDKDVGDGKTLKYYMYVVCE